MSAAPDRTPVLEGPEALPGSGAVLGIDPGARSLGIAVSDPDRRVASPLGRLRRGSLAELVAGLAPILESRRVDALVVGLPRTLAGGEGPSAQSARALARNLARELRLPVALWDERLSTAAAERALLADDVSRRRRAQLVDGVAAAFILQGALDRMAATEGTRPVAPPTEAPLTAGPPGRRKPNRRLRNRSGEAG